MTWKARLERRDQETRKHIFVFGFSLWVRAVWTATGVFTADGVPAHVPRCPAGGA